MDLDEAIAVVLVEQLLQSGSRDEILYGKAWRVIVDEVEQIKQRDNG